MIRSLHVEKTEKSIWSALKFIEVNLGLSSSYEIAFEK